MTLSNLTTVGNVHAQISTKPAKPNFTINIQNETVVLTIENQPFDVHNSYNYSFFYDVRIMNIDGDWSSFYTAEDRPTQSNSSHTVFYYAIGESEYFPSVTTLAGIVIPAYGQVFFQVMALIGYLERTVYSDGFVSYGLKGEVSGWSDSQTITLPTTNAQIPTLYNSPTGLGSTASYNLILFSPNDQTIYKNVLHLGFILRWIFHKRYLFELSANYAYSIDGNPFVSIVPKQSSNDRYGGGGKILNPSFSYLLDISNLTDGSHELVIKANFGKNLVLNDTSKPFIFKVQNPTLQNPTPTPTPTASPTLSPTPTPEPTPTPTTESEPFPTTIAIASIAIMAVIGIGILVYLKKYRK